jgi:hypothetical protein
LPALPLRPGWIGRQSLDSELQISSTMILLIFSNMDAFIDPPDSINQYFQQKQHYILLAYFSPKIKLFINPNAISLLTAAALTTFRLSYFSFVPQKQPLQWPTNNAKY